MASKKEVMIVNRRSKKALQATGLDNGQVVEQAAATGADNQLWTVVEAEGGVKLCNKANGKVLDVMQGGTADGTWAQTWEDVGGESQLWTVENVTPTYKKLIQDYFGVETTFDVGESQSPRKGKDGHEGRRTYTINIDAANRSEQILREDVYKRQPIRWPDFRPPSSPCSRCSWWSAPSSCWCCRS